MNSRYNGGMKVPVLIFILGGIHILWGVFVIVQNILFVDVLSASSGDFRGQLFSLVAVTVAVQVVSILAGVGIFLQKKGGWVLSLFYFCYQCVETGYALGRVLLSDYSPELRIQPTGDLRTYYGTQVIFFLCMMLFLVLNAGISAYFSLTVRSKLITLGSVLAFSIVLFVLTEFYTASM